VLILRVSANPGSLFRLKDMSVEAEAVLGYNKAEILNREFSIVLPPPIAENHNAYMNRALTTGQWRSVSIDFPAQIRKKNGYYTQITLHIKIRPVLDEGIQFLGLFFQSDKRILIGSKMFTPKNKVISTLEMIFSHCF
jgi:PAS domain S-box-containing protein